MTDIELKDKVRKNIQELIRITEETKKMIEDYEISQLEEEFGRGKDDFRDEIHNRISEERG